MQCVAVLLALPVAARAPRRSRRSPGRCRRRRRGGRRDTDAAAGAAEPVREPSRCRPSRLPRDSLSVDRHRRASTRTRRSSRCSSPSTAPRSMRPAQQALNANAEMLKKYPTWVDHHRGTLRRARHGGIQPGARRAARAGGADLPGVARHSGRPAADGQLRQGISVRSRPRRGRLVEEPPRALRGDEQIGQGSDGRR